jgi:hypothetical protein
MIHRLLQLVLAIVLTAIVIGSLARAIPAAASHSEAAEPAQSIRSI